MGNHLHEPPNAQVTSTRQSLKESPSDMPGWKARQGQAQITSSQVPLSRKENPVAAFGAHPNQGTAQITSSQVPLKKNAVSPYEPLSGTKPQVSGGGDHY